MIKKNKDGSYNKFQLTIISLITILSILIIGSILLQNITIPTIQLNQPIKINNTTDETLSNTIPLINDNGTLSWRENSTSLIDPTLNTTYVPIGVNTTYYTNDGGQGKTYAINNTIAYVIVASGGGGGSSNLYESTNITYTKRGSESSDLYENTIINSTQSPITPIQQPIIESSNTSQNITIMTSMINIINTFPNILWISMIFLFGLTMISGFSHNTTTGIIFSSILIVILYYLNIIQINNILIFIVPLLFICIYIKMLFPRR